MAEVIYLVLQPELFFGTSHGPSIGAVIQRFNLIKGLLLVHVHMLIGDELGHLFIMSLR